MAGGTFELTVLALSELMEEGLCMPQDWYDLDHIEDALGRFDLLAARQYGS